MVVTIIVVRTPILELELGQLVSLSRQIIVVVVAVNSPSEQVITRVYNVV